MHFIRICTARLVTVTRSSRGGGCLPIGDVYLGACLPRRCLPGGVVWPGGCLARGKHPRTRSRRPLWTEWLADKCINITFPQPLRAVNMIQLPQGRVRSKSNICALIWKNGRKFAWKAEFFCCEIDFFPFLYFWSVLFSLCCELSVILTLQFYVRMGIKNNYFFKLKIIKVKYLRLRQWRSNKLNQAKEIFLWHSSFPVIHKVGHEIFPKWNWNSVNSVNSGNLIITVAWIEVN